MIPIALQLYSLREDSAKDFPAVLKAVAEMGYDGVEFAGYHDFSAKELKKMLDDLGLKVAGTHTGLDTLLGDEFEKTVEFNKVIGNKFLIVPGLDEQYTANVDTWIKTADIFNEIAAKLAPLGMVTGYHNHWSEFAPENGRIPWDEFFSHTNDGVVMQLDTGNAKHGDADPSHYLRKFAGRATCVHLKPFKEGDETVVIGKDELDWEEILGLCETVGGTEWYIVEQESYPTTPLETVKIDLDALRAMGR